MKWQRAFTITIIMGIVILLLSTAVVNASTLAKLNHNSEEKIKIEKDEIINRDVFIINKDLLNKGELIGDVFFIGNILENRGFISGDILGIFPELIVDERIRGNIRGIGRKVKISGEVNRNITLVAKQFWLEDQGRIDGSVTVIGDKVLIEGSVGSDIRGVTNVLTINGIIKGDINVKSKEIHFGKDAIVMGNIRYHSDKELDIPSDKIKGEIIHIQPKTSALKILAIKGIRNLRIITHISSIASLLLISLLIIKFAQTEYNKLYKGLKENSKECLKLGSLVTFIVPIIFLILAATIIFTPISMMISALYFIVMYISKIPVAIFIGEIIIVKKGYSPLKVLIGLIILVVLGYIPYLGGVIVLATFILGSGAIVFYLKEIIKKIKSILELSMYIFNS